MLEPSTSAEVYCCTLCSYQAERAFQVHNHVRRTHKNATTIVDATVEPEQMFCISCDFMTSHKLALYEHYNQKHGTSRTRATSRDCEQFVWYKCKRCRLRMYASIQLVKHLQTCAVSKRNVQNVRMEHPKIVIDLTLADKRRKAKNKHDYPFKCTECPYDSNMKSKLKRHMMLQHADDAEIKWHKCEQCPYVSKYKHGLLSHVLQRHAKDEEVTWHQCEQCPYRTKAKFNLTKHMVKHASHEQIEWHQCEHCPYQAKRKMYLTQHMLTHAAPDEIKWYECEHCEYKAKTKVHLKRHIFRKHKEAYDMFVERQQRELLERHKRTRPLCS